MKAYNPSILLNSFLNKKAKFWHSQNLLSEKQYNDILNHYKYDFYTPNVFVKIGLFIFVCFIILAAMGIYSLFLSPMITGNSNGFFIFSAFIFSTGCFVFLEFFIRNNKIYNSGTDEALLYIGLIFLLTAIYLIMDSAEMTGSLTYFIAALPFLFFALYRYADRIVTLAFFICLFSVLFLFIVKMGEIAKMILPFLMMICSSVFYFQIIKHKKKSTLFYWKSCLVFMEYLCLITFYVFCNYYVIRESSIYFFQLVLSQGENIPLAPLFYLLTAAVPLVYIYFGLKNRNKTLLWSGLILLAVSAITFKYYFSMGHPEIALTAAGIILMLCAYFSIRYLKTPKHRITFEPVPDEDSVLKSNAEALIILESLTKKQDQGSSQESIHYGGGKSGGAGSGDSF